MDPVLDFLSRPVTSPILPRGDTPDIVVPPPSRRDTETMSVLTQQSSQESVSIHRTAVRVPEGLLEAEKFQDGLARGPGILQYASGSQFLKYEGEFFDNQPHGQGTMTFVNGNVYVGYFSGGKMTGYGKLTYSSPNEAMHISYEGQFIDGLPDGYGTLVNAHFTYTGNFKNGIIVEETRNRSSEEATPAVSNTIRDLILNDFFDG